MRTHRLTEICGIRSVLTQTLSFATLVFALATTCVLPAQTTGAGTITGRVSNAATSANLEGAIVRLEGTNFSAQTERDGTFRLQVPAGSYTLVASYTALDAQSIPVSVEAGAMVQRDIRLTAEIYKMEKFTVAGEREGNALAITLQRHSDGVKNVVSADAFGNLAGNPADLLMRMPGIAGESVGGDIRFIRIRGLHHNLASVSMDGNRLADAASAGTTREVQWQQAGTETVERVEVTKSPTPDMPADSIGGAVNIVDQERLRSIARAAPRRIVRRGLAADGRAVPPDATVDGVVFGGLQGEVRRIIQLWIPAGGVADRRGDATPSSAARRGGRSGVHLQPRYEGFREQAHPLGWGLEARLQVERAQSLLRQRHLEQS